MMTAAARPALRPRVLLAAVSVLALALGAAAAQSAKPTLDEVRQRDQELEAVRAQQRKAIDGEKKLRAEIDAIGEDRRKLNQSLIDTAAGIRTVEARIADAEARLKPLLESESSIRKSLDSRRAVIVEVLAALQRMGRRPPPAVLVRPEDALESVRAAMLLGAVVPEMRSEAESLAADLGGLVRVRAEAAAERDGLASNLAALAENKFRMSLLIDARQKRQGDAEKELGG